MSTPAPRPGPLQQEGAARPAPQQEGAARPAPQGSAAWRAEIAPEEVDPAARVHWEAEADAYQAEHGGFLGADGGAGFVWGPEGLTEAEAGMLGPLDALRGCRVLEVGCGAAQCSAWLAARGVHSVGVDIAVNQLRHAPAHRAGSRTPLATAPCHPSGHPMAPGMTTPGAPAPSPPTPADGAGDDAPGSLHVAAATATALPFPTGTFDAAFSSYGAVQFVADLDRLLDEVARVLRPGGRWAFSVTHPIRWAFPDDPGPGGLSVSGSYFDRIPYVERAVTDGRAVYAEFHRTLGDYVAALRRAGFGIEAMVEPEWPEWNERTWGGWSPQRGMLLPGTLVIGCRAATRA